MCVWTGQYNPGLHYLLQVYIIKNTAYLDISGSIVLVEAGVDLGKLDVHTSQVYNQWWGGLLEVVALSVVAS